MAYRFVFESPPHLKHDIFYFYFSKVLTKEDINQLTQKVTSTLEKEGSTSVIHIWDCTTMSRFDFSAKSLWEKILKENSKRIDSVYLISDKKFIQLAAKIMSVIVNFKLIILDSIDEIPAHIADNLPADMRMTEESILNE